MTTHLSMKAFQYCASISLLTASIAACGWSIVATSPSVWPTMVEAGVQLPPAINSQLRSMLGRFDFAFVVSDCRKHDMPIVFASQRFFDMTGYSPEEILGKNCRFLQGPKTERRKVMEIRDAIREDRCCQVCLLNYRKDGSTFLNQFFLSPIKDEQGIVTHYVGIQTDVSAVADKLHTPCSLLEQQAAVVFGQAAGCNMCDVMMQQQQVAQQLEQQARQEQQQQQPCQEQQQQTAAAAAAAAVGEQRQPLSPVMSDEESDVIREGLRHACQIHDVMQQSHPHAEVHLPSSLMQPLMAIQQSYVLSDPRLPDCPIIHASQHFLDLTGYSREEVVGRNCRFLQGPGTDPGELAKLRSALAATPPQPVTVTLLNYTKQGRPFWNALHVAPVRDADGQLEYLIGIQLDVSCVDGDGDGEAGAAGAGLPTAPAKLHLSQKMAHYSVTGAVRVACRGLSGCSGGLRRSMDCQGLPRRGYSRSISRSISMDGSRSSTSSGGGGGSRKGSAGGANGPRQGLSAAVSAPSAAVAAAIAEAAGQE